MPYAPAPETGGLVRRTSYEDALRDLLATAGVTIGGAEPHDITVHDGRFYKRVMRDGSLGFGETYMLGWWDSPAVDQLTTRLLSANLARAIRHSPRYLAHALRARVLNLQTPGRAFEVAERHYDLGNDLFEAMLDREMNYSCAYWKAATDLDTAQIAKLDLICRKIGLGAGMSVLDLGCGWGAFARYAARQYGATVTGITVSREQAALAAVRCEGLPVDIQIRDYREATGRYDRIVSIGMMEHIGVRNYRAYMQVIERCMTPDGIALVHTIGGNRTTPAMDPWINKYIFPNAALPSMSAIALAMEDQLVVEDVHNIGPDYDRTLMAWNTNFEKAWPALRERYGEQFFRMWRYYLLTAAASFRARYLQLFQVVITKVGRAHPNCRLE